MVLAIIGKVILKLLAILFMLLLIVILLALAILFVHIRYSLRLEKYDDEINYCLKIFGVDYNKIKNLFKRKHRGSRKKKPRKASKSPKTKKPTEVKQTRLTKKSNQADNPQRIDNSQQIERSQPISQLKKTEEPTEEPIEEPTVQQELIQRDATAEKESARAGLLQKLKDIITGIYDKFTDVMKFIKKLIEGLRDTGNKAVLVKRFVFSETTSGFVCVARDNVLHLWKHIKPRKIKSDIIFGTGDPATTGELLGVVAASTACFGVMLNVHPDFDNMVLKGYIEIKGRVSVFTFIRVIYSTIRSKEWKDIQREANKLKEEL